MPQPRHRFDQAIRRAVATMPQATVKEIRDHLKGEMARYDIPERDVPSEATITRRRRELSEEDLKEWRMVRWPESFGIPGGLDWDMAPAVVELLRANRALGIDEPVPLSFARWFAYLTNCAPEQAPDTRRWLAMWLTFADLGWASLEHMRRNVEAEITGGDAPFVYSVEPGLEGLDEYFSLLVLGRRYVRGADGVLDRRRLELQRRREEQNDATQG
jgi:hypothetical protein